jgi:hypothetical protein
MLNETNDTRIVDRPPKKSPIFPNMSFMIYDFFKAPTPGSLKLF